MIKTDLSSVDNQHENSHTYSYGIYANILREVCVLGAQQMLMYILYAAQGCSHSPTLISNTDNEETAAVTMETSEEDTEACVVVLLHGNSANGVDSTWIWFPLNRTVQGHCFNRCVSVAALMTHTVISDSSLESKAPLLRWQYLHTCSNSQRLISTAFFGSAFSGGHTCTSRRIMAEHAAPGFFPLSGLMAGLKAEHQSTMLIQSRSATSAFLPWVQIFSRYCWWVWPRVEKSPTVHSQSGTDYLAWLDQDWCLQIGRNNSIRSHSILLTFKVAWVSLKFAFAKHISASIRELFLNDWYVKCFFQNVSKKKKKQLVFVLYFIAKCVQQCSNPEKSWTLKVMVRFIRSSVVVISTMSWIWTPPMIPHYLILSVVYLTCVLELTKLTEDIHHDVDLSLSVHVRDVVNIAGVDSGVWWLHVADYYWGVPGRGGRRRPLQPALVFIWDKFISWLIIIHLEAHGNRLNTMKTLDIVHTRLLTLCRPG